MLIKKKIIYFLIAITVVLLIANLLAEKYAEKHGSPIPASSLVTKSEIEQKFKRVLDLYDIKPEWIKKGKLKKKNKRDSLDYYYKIKIPKSVLVPNLIKDLSKTFASDDVRITSEEKHNFGNSTIKIINGKQAKLLAQFIYSKDLKTDRVNIGFILAGIDDLSEEELTELLSIPLPFGVMILPDRNIEPLLDRITDANKQFYLLLSEDIDDERYELNEEFTKEVLRVHLRHIFDFYKRNKFFVIDKKSELYRSLAFEYIAKVLKRNLKKLYFLQDFIKLKGESEEDLSSLFEFHLKNINEKSRKVFLLEAADFENLLDEILAFTKKGNGVKFPTQILK